MLYVPVYRAGANIDAVEERRAAFRGTVGTTFSANEFFDQTAEMSGGDVSMTVYYGGMKSENYVYGPRKSHFAAVGTLELAGTVWTAGWERGPSYVGMSRKPAIMAGGLALLTSLLLAGLIANLQPTNRRAAAIVQTRTAELANAVQAAVGQPREIGISRRT